MLDWAAIVRSEGELLRIILLAAMLSTVAPGAGAEAESSDSDASSEVVILLHGLARSEFAMRSLESRLGAAGYTVHNVNYPSTELSPDELDDYLDAMQKKVMEGDD